MPFVFPGCQRRTKMVICAVMLAHGTIAQSCQPRNKRNSTNTVARARILLFLAGYLYTSTVSWLSFVCPCVQGSLVSPLLAGLVFVMFCGMFLISERVSTLVVCVIVIFLTTIRLSPSNDDAKVVSLEPSSTQFPLEYSRIPLCTLTNQTRP